MVDRILYRLAESVRAMVPGPPISFPHFNSQRRTSFPEPSFTSSYLPSAQTISSPSTSSSCPHSSPSVPPNSPSLHTSFSSVSTSYPASSTSSTASTSTPSSPSLPSSKLHPAFDFRTQLNRRINVGVESRKFMLLFTLLATLCIECAAFGACIFLLDTRSVFLSTIIAFVGAGVYAALLGLLVWTRDPPMVASLLCLYVWGHILTLYLLFGTNELFVWFVLLPIINFFIVGTKRGIAALIAVLLQGFILPSLRFVDTGITSGITCGINPDGGITHADGVEPFYTSQFGRAFTSNALILCLSVVCLVYEYSDAFVLQRLRAALEEKELVNTKLKLATDSKSKFLANMSHELRTPLHGIVAMAKELFGTPLTPKMREAVKIISDCADHLNALVDDILDFERIESGRMELEQIPFSILKEAENVINMLALPAEKKHLVVKKNFEVEAESHIGDPLRFRQILFNLLSNAIKFTPDSGMISITMKNKATAPEVVEFEIVDTGIGISEQNIPHLFTSFYQLDSSIGRKYGGSGLGLAISRRLCEAMNGIIGCESRLGQGSRFWFSVRLPVCSITVDEHLEALNQDSDDDDYEENAGVEGIAKPSNTTPATPRSRMSSEALVEAAAIKHKESSSPSEAAIAKDGERSAARASPLPSAVQRVTGRKKSLKDAPLVLLVEDNVINQKVGVRMLNTLGYQVDVAENGLIGFKMAEHQNYDLILMDCQMPELDGFEATRHIREMERQRNSGRSPNSLLTTIRNCARTMSAGNLEPATNSHKRAHSLAGSESASRIPTRFGLCASTSASPKSTPVDSPAMAVSPLMSSHNTQHDTNGPMQPPLEQELPPGYVRPVPIIALTASATMDYQKRCLDCGMNDFLAKPLNRDTLQNTLRKWLPSAPAPPATATAAATTATTTAKTSASGFATPVTASPLLTSASSSPHSTSSFSSPSAASPITTKKTHYNEKSNSLPSPVVRRIGTMGTSHSQEM